MNRFDDGMLGEPSGDAHALLGVGPHGVRGRIDGVEGEPAIEVVGDR